jgi:hypothetical protein
MKKIAIGSAVILVCLAISSVEAFESKFGFKANIPSEWLIITAEELKKNPDLINLQHEAFKSIDKNILNDIANKVRQGSLEFFLYKGGGSARTFVDNINVFKQADRVPQSDSEVKAACRELPAAMSKMIGKTVVVHECGSRKVAGLPAFYAEFDGIVNGTRSLSYQIQWSPNFVLVFTATCNNQSVDTIRKAFDEIVNSIH